MKRMYSGIDIDQAELVEALLDLPAPNREAITWKDIMGYPYELVAKEMGIPEPEAKVYVTQGRMALKETLFPTNA